MICRDFLSSAIALAECRHTQDSHRTFLTTRTLPLNTRNRILILLSMIPKSRGVVYEDTGGSVSLSSGI